ncbi:M20/M25/M40 family metallo-hydrolase [Sphingomonas sp. HDW15A]|uniref:M20/M25/M40 family metallo-hydrolase n=1 Tax=Sphingomonas sp. HDW15A TaxID=2714942 RepID=UPI001408AA59|nr:M20/M25/M40 family metallo-hydrolase [Sphingomonas sp. HDW15A]QIK96166.1 M20/M25/M40 family metallo-hydrolase [Sphingomonas sp. HDW15A]
MITAIADSEMRGLIATLASDTFLGRMSGTEGEKKTIAYIAGQLSAYGVSAGMPDGSYFMPFAIPAQKKAVPKDAPGYPGGQVEFHRVMNAMGATGSNNVVGRVAGRNPDGKAVVLMAHWDHLGLCRPAGEPDRICNGAVDNASGTAALLAVAARVSRMRLDRDVWFVFTGAEEWGLLGAKAFAEKPPLPLGAIVAGFNLDTIAVVSAGMPVAMVAEKNSPLVPLVKDAAIAVGRSWDGDDEAAPFIERQDGWPLTQKKVPMVMAGGSFSDMKRLQAFLGKDYHGQNDELTVHTDLGGAVEDANLHIELVRRAASRSFQPKAN